MILQLCLIKIESCTFAFNKGTVTNIRTSVNRNFRFIFIIISLIMD